MMLAYAVKEMPIFHSIPMATVKIKPPRVYIELDDENEDRYLLEFSPYQSIKVTTDDCYCFSGELNVPDGDESIQGKVVEIHNSIWIEELKGQLKKTDVDANFLDDAKHFLIPIDDAVLEIVSSEMKVEKIA